jgi:hypothetical protein
VEDIGKNRNEVNQGQFTTMGDVLVKYAEKIVNETRDNLERANKDATNSLIASIRPEFKMFGFQIIMEEHYIYVDEGRKPNSKMPPEAPILNWIKNRGIKIKNHKDLKKKGLNLDKQYKSLAYLMRRKIGREGIKPTHFLSSVVDGKFVQDLKTDLTKAGRKDIELNFKIIADTVNKR